MKITRSFLFILGSTLCALPSLAQWTTSSNDIYNSNSGNVGIGTSSPLYKLDVNGTARIGTMVLAGGATGRIAIGGTVSGNNRISIGENSTASQSAIAIGTNVIADLNSVSVGINGGAGSTAISIGIGSYAYQYSIALGFEAVTNNFYQATGNADGGPVTKN